MHTHQQTLASTSLALNNGILTLFFFFFKVRGCEFLLLVHFCRGTGAEKLKRPAISEQLNVTMYTHISSPCHSGTSIRLDLLTNSSAHTVGYVHPLQIRKGLHLHQHTYTQAYHTLARYLWKCQQIAPLNNKVLHLLSQNATSHR